MLPDEDEEDEEPYGAPPVVEVTVYTENFLTGEGEARRGFKDYDDYMAWIGRHEGLLCTLRCAEGVITLRGDGQGGVLIDGAWDGPEGPFPVTDVVQRTRRCRSFRVRRGVRIRCLGTREMSPRS